MNYIQFCHAEYEHLKITISKSYVVCAQLGNFARIFCRMLLLIKLSKRVLNFKENVLQNTAPFTY